MISPHQPVRQHGIRFYIVAITIMVIAIFAFFYLNEEISLTGATTGVDKIINSEPEIVTGSSNEKVEIENMEKQVALTFDQAPDIDTEAKIRLIIVTFDDLSSVININKDRLELANLEQVKLQIEDFFGDFILEDGTVSIDGHTKRIEVNNVALSSKGDIQLSFSNLQYSDLVVDEIRLPELNLPVGEGQLKVSEKLEYSLYDESVTLNYFSGDLVLGSSANATLGLDGSVKGLSVSGEVFSLDLN